MCLYCICVRKYINPLSYKTPHIPFSQQVMGPQTQTFYLFFVWFVCLCTWRTKTYCVCCECACVAKYCESTCKWGNNFMLKLHECCMCCWNVQVCECECTCMCTKRNMCLCACVHGVLYVCEHTWLWLSMWLWVELWCAARRVCEQTLTWLVLV